jgi:light-harvesting protein B-800-850 alpha chain
MNQAKIWLVVKPSVGLPLFLGAVATIALLVHFAILTHTDWFSGYWQGGHKAKVALASPAPAAAMDLTLNTTK